MGTAAFRSKPKKIVLKFGSQQSSTVSVRSTLVLTIFVFNRHKIADHTTDIYLPNYRITPAHSVGYDIPIERVDKQPQDVTGATYLNIRKDKMQPVRIPSPAGFLHFGSSNLQSLLAAITPSSLRSLTWILKTLQKKEAALRRDPGAAIKWD